MLRDNVDNQRLIGTHTEVSEYEHVDTDSEGSGTVPEVIINVQNSVVFQNGLGHQQRERLFSSNDKAHL